jgi:hypothetical protein
MGDMADFLLEQADADVGGVKADPLPSVCEKPAIRAGQFVYLRPLCNAARYSKEIKIGVISKVGNKYFEIVGDRRNRYFKDTLLQDGRGYSPDWKAYLTMKEIEDEDEFASMVSFFQDMFNVFNRELLPSLDSLREMYKIATIGNKKEVGDNEY